MKDKNATDDDIEELKQELYICEQKIKLTNEKSLLELLSMLSGNIDWMTVSATNMEGIRTPEECENMWYNVLGFHINKDVFSEEEDNKLIDLAEEFNDRNWDIIAAALKTQRTAIQCFERYQTRLSSNLKKKYWTKEEDERLIELVEEHKCGEIIPWNKLSLMMEGRTRQQIINRFERSISQRDNRFAWSPEEDGLLVGLYQKYGAKWNKMGSYFKRRSTYAIRERYCNALIPNVRVGPWSQEEDKQLISLIRKYGYGRWAKICRRLKGRTDNMCLIRAGRLLEWSIKYHNERGTGEYDPNVNDPLMFAKILRPCAPSKYCPIRNERLRSYRENGLKMLVKALETVAPEYKAGIHDLESVDVSWMSSEMLHKLSHVLHAHLAERKKQEMNPVPPLKYITKPVLKRKRGEPEPECDEATYFKPPDRDISREEKELVDSALYMMFDMQSDITPNVTKKTQNFGSRQCAEMSLYKAYLYKQFHCKALCDEDDDLDHVVFAKVDYRETLQTVSSYFIQPPVYDNQFIVLAPNLTTMLGIEAIQATENRLLSMSEFASHSKPYIDYLCDRRKCCPRCLQCLRRSGNITSSATPESIMANMNKKSFLLDEKLENAACIEGASTNRLHTSCTCKSLEYSQKSVQLLRKRFLSLFLWPSFFSSVEFGKEQENVIINESANDDYSLDPMDSQGPKGNHQKRKRKANPTKQTRKKRKPNEPVNERDPDDPERAPDPESNPEPKPKRKRTQLKIKSAENITSQQILRRSHRSSVLNRSSFAFTKRKGNKSTPKTSQELTAEEIADNVPLSADNNLSQIPEENKSVTPSLPEKKNRRKSRKSVKKTDHELSVMEITSDSMVPSANGISNSIHLSEKDNTSPLSEKRNERRSRKSTPKSSNELVSEIISNAISPSVKKTNLSHLPEENGHDKPSLPEKTNKRKSCKSSQKTNHELSVSEIISQNVLPLADEINNLSQLPKENRCDILSLPEKTYRSRKSTSKTNESSVSEIIPSDLPPSTDENDALSQLPKESRYDVVTLPEKKNRFRNGKSKTKTNHESSVSEIISHDIPSSANEINSSSQLPKENRCDILSLPKKKYRSLKSTSKTNESSISEIISSDLPPSTDENDALSQLSKESRYDVVSLPEKKNRFRNDKSKTKTNHESSANEINSSSQLPKENRCDILSLPERKYVHRSHKTAPKTCHESSVSEINSHDISPSANEINSSSQLPEENKCDTSFLPEKKNRLRSSELSPKTNRELSVVDIVSHDRLPSADGNNNSSQLLEDIGCKSGTSPLPRKRNARKSKPTQETSHELSVMEIISDTSTLANRIQLPQENEVDTPSLPERNKRKSRKPIQKTNHDFPVLEKTSNNIPTSTSGISDTSALQEKRNNLSTLLDEIKTRASDLSDKNMDTASVLLDENRDSGLLLSKKNKSIASILEDKKGKNIKSMLHIPDESRDRVFEKDSIDSTIILPEDDSDNASSLQNEGDNNGNNVSMLSDNHSDDVEEENSICVLSPEKDSSPLVIQDEIEIASDVSSLTDDHRDSVLPLSEGNSILLSPEESGNGSPVIKDKEEGESDISPPDSVLPLSAVNSNVSSPAFLDRNSDSVAILEERSTSIMPEEVLISSDSSGDHHQDSETEAQDISFNSVLELSEKNICFK